VLSFNCFFIVFFRFFYSSSISSVQFLSGSCCCSQCWYIHWNRRSVVSIPQNTCTSFFVWGFFRFLNACTRWFLGRTQTTVSFPTVSLETIAQPNSTSSPTQNFELLASGSSFYRVPKTCLILFWSLQVFLNIWANHPYSWCSSSRWFISHHLWDK